MNIGNEKWVLNQIETRLKQAGFHSPCLKRVKNEYTGKFEYRFTIAQNTQDYNGYVVYYFETSYKSYFEIKFNKTQYYDDEDKLLDIQRQPSGTLTMLECYRTIIDLLNSLIKIS